MIFTKIATHTQLQYEELYVLINFIMVSIHNACASIKAPTYIHKMAIFIHNLYLNKARKNILKVKQMIKNKVILKL